MNCNLFTSTYIPINSVYSVDSAFPVDVIYFYDFYNRLFLVAFSTYLQL